MLPCYKTEIEGHYSDQLSNPEWGPFSSAAAPQCYPIDVNEDTAGLILEGYIRAPQQLRERDRPCELLRADG